MAIQERKWKDRRRESRGPEERRVWTPEARIAQRELVSSIHHDRTRFAAWAVGLHLLGVAFIVTLLSYPHVH